MTDVEPLSRSVVRRRNLECEVCGAGAMPAGTATSRLDGRPYALARCDACGFAFVTAPRTDFQNIYDEAYYAGRGADPAVDYARELTDPSTIRRHEWQGIVETVRRLHPDPIATWLDFGCGYGGLVRHLRELGIGASGFDEGFGGEQARARGLPVLRRSELATVQGTFDVVTAIEVLEHVLDPVAVMEEIARLLRPGGLLFVTTGNVAPHRDRLASWSYVVPDVHISYYEPRTLALIYRASGLDVVPVGYGPGTTDIIRYKVLKSLGRRREEGWQRLVPWGVAGRIVDWRYGVTRQPAARRPAHA